MFRRRSERPSTPPDTNRHLASGKKLEDMDRAPRHEMGVGNCRPYQIHNS